MRKILIINTIGIGREGISSVIYNYCSNMNYPEFSFTFVTPKIHKIKKDVKEQFETIGRVCLLSDRQNKTLFYLKELKRLLKQEKFDVIHIHGNSGTMLLEVLIAKICGIKYIITHCHNIVCDHWIINKIFRIPMIWMATSLLACSKEAGEFLYGSHDFKVLNNAIDADKYKFNVETRRTYRTKFKIADN